MKTLCALLIAIFGPTTATALAAQTAAAPIRVVIVGLVHGHVKGFLHNLPNSKDATLVGIVEPDTALAAQYEREYKLEHHLFHTDLSEALSSTHPDAVLVYTTILDHRRVIEAAANRSISSMVEKPLATTMDDAFAIRDAARRHHVHVLVNYETTWYASNAEALQKAASGELGDIRKVVVHDGHQGPAEIGVGPEWLPWLTDPKQNGAGALFDFGCYGADLITVLTHGTTPISVTAVSQTDKPNIYPRVDDDSTVIVRYPRMQAVLMPSWDWTYSRKDMELYGTKAALTTVGPASIRTRTDAGKEDSVSTSPSLPASQATSLGYLAAVLHGEVKDDGDLSALDTNMIAMQILDAARTSAATGHTVMLHPLPQ